MPITRIIRFTETLFKDLRAYLLQNENEQICYLFCHTVEKNDKVIFLPRKIIAFSKEKEVQSQHRAGIRLDKTIAREVYIRFAENDFTGLINCHSHPFEAGDVWFSTIDDEGDKSESEYVYEEIPRWKKMNNKTHDLHFISMVFGQQTIAARAYDSVASVFLPIDEIVVLNDPVEYIIPSNNETKTVLTADARSILDRQILAFGEDGQKTISSLTVSIIGVGGIGSIVAEGLCRLGVRNFVLIDSDNIETSNLNRWQGAKYIDIGKYKVDVCKKYLQQMFPDVEIREIREDLYQIDSINAVKFSDCLIGGLDNPESRYFLNRISLQYLIPYLDAGTVIISNNSKVENIKMRLGLVIPGLTRCFNCSGINYYNKSEVRNFFLDLDTRDNLMKGGYLKGAESITDPAVYPLNMAISSFLLFEFHNLFTGYKPVYWNLYLDYLNLNDNQKRCLNTIDDFEGNASSCITCDRYIGTGDNEPLSFFLKRNKKIILRK